MPHLVEVAFKGNRKEFFLWNGEEPPAVRAAVVVEADRGEDLGRVHAVGDLAALRARGCTHGTGGSEPAQKVVRLASADDVRRLDELRQQDDAVRREAAQLVESHGLTMKLTDTEWRWDRRKLTVYFTADRRVDFRSLVRDLAARFRTRIELRQIGVRDEAKRLDGVGRCGRQYCSASWLPDLRPVSLGLAKDQKLSLNPTQISGACGRLMCCIRYEHDWYVSTRRQFPKEGKVITTAQGEERVVLNDLFRERVTLRKVSDGETRIIPLEQLNRELRGEIVETDASTEFTVPEEWSDELLAMTDTVERPIPRGPDGGPLVPAPRRQQIGAPPVPDSRGPQGARGGPSPRSQESRPQRPTGHRPPRPQERVTIGRAKPRPQPADATKPPVPAREQPTSVGDEGLTPHLAETREPTAAGDAKARRRRRRRGRNRGRDQGEGGGGGPASPSPRDGGDS